MASFFAPEQWAENTDGGPHFSHDLVGGIGDDLFRLDGDHATGALHLRAEVREDLEHVVDIAQIRHVVNHARLPS